MIKTMNTDCGTNGTNAGNTKKQRLRYRHFCFTFNNPKEHNCPDYDTMAQIFLSEGAKLFVYQLEEGDEYGTTHLQGVVSFENPKEFSVLKGINNAIHWEQCKNLQASIKYCSKTETRIDGPWYYGLELPKTFKIEKLKPWQQNVIDIIKNCKSDRFIYWFWENIGNVGKTTLAKHICSNYNAIFVSGRASDVKCAIAKMKTKPKIVIFHYVRSQEDFVSYQAIEEIKDGIFFSGKYESQMCMFDSPLILCFSNFKPDTTEMSADRWKITEIIEKEENEIIPKWLFK